MNTRRRGLLHRPWGVIRRLSEILVTLAALFVLSNYNFLLFHGITELLSIAVAWSLFLLVWNTRGISSNNALSFLGTVYLSVGFIDLLHMLFYKGMGVFAPELAANRATQLWIVARSLETTGLLTYSLFLSKRIPLQLAAVGYGAATVLLLASIFLWNIFPDCYVEGAGLTAFKVGTEYVICLTLIAAIALLFRQRQRLDAEIFWNMVIAMLFTIAAELSFTLYISVYGMSNVMGHVFKIISFGFVYLALIRSSLIQPYNALFRDLNAEKQALQESEAKYRTLIETAHDLILIIDSSGRIQMSNQAETFVGDLFAFVHPDDRDRVRGLISQVFGNGIPVLIEMKFQLSGGRIGHYEAKVSPLAVGGTIRNAFTIFRDVSDAVQIRAIMAARLRLLERATHASMEELLRMTLDEAERLSESRIGFYHFIDPIENAIQLQAWSTQTLKACSAEGSGWHYPAAQAGVWADALREGRPVIHNAYASLPHRKGLPGGHADIVRELVVPVHRQGRIVALLGVGNKDRDYVQADIEMMASLADLAWDIVERKRWEVSLERRLASLVRPVSETSDLTFQDLFAMEDIQDLQDKFSNAMGVGSLIADPTGIPITAPSNFCRLCSMIRLTAQGLHDCTIRATTGESHRDGWRLQHCANGVIMHATASVTLSGKIVANWLIGHVRDPNVSEENVRSYARKIGVDEASLVHAFREIPEMTRERFGLVGAALNTLANQLSAVAFQNILQARTIAEMERLKREDHTLSQLGQLLNATLDITEIYNRLAAEIKHLIPYDRLAVTLIVQEGERAFIAYTTGALLCNHGVGSSFPTPGSLIDLICTQGKGIVIQPEEAQALTGSHPHLAALFTPEVGSVMSVPLLSHGKIIGALDFWSITPMVYGERDIRLAEKVATYISQAISNANLYSECDRMAQDAQERQRTLSSLVENLPGFVYRREADIANIFSFISDQCLDITGFRPADFSLHGVQYDDLVQADYRQWYRSEWERAILQQRPFEGEYPLQTANKGVKWLWERGEGRFDPNGQLLFIEGFVADVTARKDVEAALERQHKLMATVFNTTPGFLVMKDTQGIYQAVNQAFCAFLGKTREQIIGKADGELFPPEDALAYQSQDRRVVLTGQIEEGDYLVAGAEGRRWLHVVKSPIPDDKGGCNGLLCSVSDISQRKTMEESLRSSEERFRLLFDSAPDGITVVDMTGSIVHCNLASGQIYNLPAEEMIGKPLATFIHPSPPPDFKFNFERLMTLAPVEGEIQILRRNGSVRDLWRKCVPLAGTEGHFVGALIYDRDITERKLTEQQLIQAQKMESVGRLAGGVAHDFNNMLGVIFGHAEMAMSMISPSMPLYADMQGIMKAAERSAALTNQLLAFARKQVVDPRIFDLNDAVDMDLRMLGRLIGEDIELVWHPCEEKCMVKIDPSQTDQILANLCVNARDAIVGNGTVHVLTHHRSIDEGYRLNHQNVVPGEYVTLTVTDTGCGISADNLDKIFEPFFTTKAAGKGTGLGLATVYGIVKQNSGWIEVVTEIGVGTSLIVFLPRYLGKKNTETHGENQKTSATGQNTTILVVEDEADMLQVIKAMLSKQGYCVLPTSRPSEALRTVEGFEGEIQLVMTDVIMPEMNGLELVEKLRASRPAIKCLYMSGYTADILSGVNFPDEGMYFIQKPFTRSDLLNKISQVIAE